MQSQRWMPTARVRAKPVRRPVERWWAGAVAVALHAGLFWLASKAQMPPGRAPADDDDPVLIWLSPPPARPLPQREPPRAATASIRRSPIRPAPSPRPAPVAEATAAGALDAIAIERDEPQAATIPAPAPVSPPAPASATRAPWDAPSPQPRPFASRSPPLPGQGAQRFRMRPPRSVAATVRQIGRMFGGGGPSDCEETRKNVRDLAVLGAEAVAQELEEERRNCGN